MKSPHQDISRTDTIKNIISPRIPTCGLDTTYQEIISIISSQSWDQIETIFVLDKSNKPVGFINLARVEQIDKPKEAHELMHPIITTLNIDSKPEKAIYHAVKDDITSIPIVDDNNHFMGAITMSTIIEIMHQEHIDQSLITTGIHSKHSNIAQLVSQELGSIVRLRVTWLVFGLFVGLGMGYISSLFEKALSRSIALAYFMPVITYIADSVGTQSEAIIVRALAVIKIDYKIYLLKEVIVGGILGLVLGSLGGIGAFLISSDKQLGLVVFISLACASTIAALIASALPIIFKLLNKDPALGSGPITTAIQDLISIVIYLVCASLLMN